MDLKLYLLFLVTTLTLIIVPGPAAITIVKQGASYSRRLTSFSVLGVATADALYFMLSATGIASLIITSSVVFTTIKWFGVGYLIFLGLAMLLSKAEKVKIETYQSKASTVEISTFKAFSQGLIVQLANPKALLYFSALLPQFIDPNESIILQMFLMGLTCFLADLVVYSMFGQMGMQLVKIKVKSWTISLINKIAGLTLITIGIKMAALEAAN